MTTKNVTIIVPVYNAQRTLHLCLDSLLAIDYPKDKLEIIMVDNNSTDDTAEIIKKYPVTYLLEDEVQSSYAARNKGIRHAKGEIIAFTDSDCIAHPDWIKEGIKPFEDPNVMVVGGKILAHTPENYIEEFQARKNILSQEEFLTPQRMKDKIAFVVTANAIYRKSVFDQIGAFDDSQPSGSDCEMCFRLQAQTDYKIRYVEEAIIYHKHRATLKDVWKQFRRYGYFGLYLLSKYPPPEAVLLPKFGYIKPLWWRFRNGILMNLVNIAKYLILSIFKKEARQQFTDTFLELIQQAASFYGEIRSARDHHIPVNYIILPLSEEQIKSMQG